MIFLRLFIEFLKIGGFSVGAYTSIPLLQDCIAETAWLDSNQFADILAVSESTPGSILVNAATFVGSVKGGILGSALATFAVVLPAFLIILLISKFFKNWITNKNVQAVLLGAKPCCIAIVLATGLGMLTSSIAPCNMLDSKAINILISLLAVIFLYGHFKQKIFTPIQLIIISAIVGIMLN